MRNPYRELIDRVARYFQDEILRGPFNPQPATTFRIPRGASPALQVIVGRLINVGAIIMIPDRGVKDVIVGEFDQHRMRLAYLVAAKEHLPPNVDRPISPRRIRALSTMVQNSLDCSRPSRLLPGLCSMGIDMSLAFGMGGTGPNSPVIISAGSLAANLHLRIQGRALNQFYEVECTVENGSLHGNYEAWTWDQHEGRWYRGQDTAAIASSGGFGHRPSPVDAAGQIDALVPVFEDGPITWLAVQEALPSMRHLTPDHKSAVLAQLDSAHGIKWESDSGRSEVSPDRLRLGRLP